jgi:integrase
MGRFRSPESQARHAIQQALAIGKPSHTQDGGDGKVHSLGTARTYADSLKCLATFIAERRLDPVGKGLASLTRETAQIYLEYRSQEVGQKQLDKDRQAMQIVLGEKLTVTKSELDQALKSRAYTQQQIQLIADAQTQKHALPTLIAADAGLRAHELLTLLPLDERAPSAHRTWTDERFEGRGEIKRYTVVGKGGLVREVAITGDLAGQLEALKLAESRIVTDRKIYYEQHYEIGGGKQWSDSFGKAAQRELAWSTGAHGVRHTYAQVRMKVLQFLGRNYETALAVVSQEMGHFRPEITEVYLR